MEEKLQALEKNRGKMNLARLEMVADLGEGPTEFELVYSFHPAREVAERAAPVVLVHGTPSTLFTWSELVNGNDSFAGLAQNRDVYAIEVIGHGVAPGHYPPYTFERCARFVAAAIRALEIDGVHLVGSSYGGEFVWRAALNEPDLMKSIVLLDSSGYPRRPEDWLSEEVVMRENALAKIGWMLNSEDRIEAALAPHFDVIPPGRVEEFFLVCENADNWKAMIDLARDENGKRGVDLKNLAMPALLVWGENDLAYPPGVYAERFARDIPEARLTVMPDTGHYPHEQRPAEVAGTLDRFFSDVEGNS